MVRNLEKTCEICLKTMRGDHLKRHLERHVKEKVKKRKIEEVGTSRKHEPAHKHQQLGFGNGVEPGKGKNPELKPEEGNNDEFIDKAEFNEKLFTREYKHKGSHDILLVGKEYKTKIKQKIEEYINKHNQLTLCMMELMG